MSDTQGTSELATHFILLKIESTTINLNDCDNHIVFYHIQNLISTV